MKVAFIGQKGIPAKQGGVEKHVEELTVQLADAGFDIYIYSRPYYTGQRHKYYRGVRIINLPSLKTKHLDAISHTFLASVHAIFQKYDIIHYHGVGPSLLSWIPRVFCPKAKVIVTFHCLDRQHQKWGFFAKLMLTMGEWTACRFPHQTITISKALQKYCQIKFNRETTYIPNGFSEIKINKKSAGQKILKKYNLNKDDYFLSVSRLVRHKGIHTLIEAYQKINTDKKLVIAGDGANTDDYVNYLFGLAKGNKNIIFTGQQTGANLQALYKNGYLFVQPSEAEGLSIALLEAMSYGLPVLISDIKENQEVASGLGLEFKNKNANSLKKQLEFSITHQEQINNLARLAKKQIFKKYNWRDIAKQTVNLYKQTTEPANLLATNLQKAR